MRCLTVIAAAFILVVVLIGGAAFALTRVAAAREAPAQPIAFDHSLHAGALGMDCQFCHRDAAVGATASIPAIQQCMFCHAYIKGSGNGPNGSNPEIAKLRQAYATNQPVNWVRVNRVPDHVHFVHENHIRAGIACQTCHGEIQTESVVAQGHSLRMGDCLNCHRQMNAPTECFTCHY